ncbi:MAG: RNA methyltransferase, partial [Bdellovibrionales bacterium]|nr:RNA methyltransferase [Bdellovibrionales bacterium]
MSKKKSSNLRWVIGIHSAEEALKERSDWVQEVLIQEDKDRELGFIQKLCEQRSVKFKTVGRKTLNNLADGHQGLAVAMNQRPLWDDSAIDKEKSLVVFLDGITDPHNLGAILRTSWLLQVDGIFIPKDRRVDLTPVVCKVASGGAEHVPVNSVHFGSQLSWFKEQGFWIYGLSAKGSQ